MLMLEQRQPCKNSIKKQEVKDTLHPDTNERMIPGPVTSFMKILPTGNSKNEAPSARIQRLVCSFGSDLVFAVTVGRTRIPKHILLPFVIKSLTGNKELIQIMNRLKHSVSHSQMEEFDTALCLQMLKLVDDGKVLLNAHPCVFTTLAWDNIDRVEKTLSRGGISHIVNGIAI